MKRPLVVAAILAGVALVVCGASCGTKYELERRADDFDRQCARLVGASRATALATFPNLPTAEMTDFSGEDELAISFHYGIAGRTTCDMAVDGGKIVRVRSIRGNDFDHCTDPVSYPRRHWLCSIGRAILP